MEMSCKYEYRVSKSLVKKKERKMPCEKVFYIDYMKQQYLGCAGLDKRNKFTCFLFTFLMWLLENMENYM